MRGDPKLGRVQNSLGVTPQSDPSQIVRPEKPEAASEARVLRAVFLGVSTILLADGETAIMTDGFFSRPGLWRVLRGVIAPDTTRIDSALKKAGATRLSAVLAAHSHHDHAMDTAVVAEKTGALIVGSQSTRNIAVGAGFPDAGIRVIEGKEYFTFGRFRVRAFRSPHSIPNLIKGNITSPLQSPARATAYKCGGNYSFLIDHDGSRVLIHPSANYSPGFMSGERADVVFLGIGALGIRGRGFIESYWREVVGATGARLVVPIHWDNFFEPLDKALKPPVLGIVFDRAMRVIRDLAEATGVVVKLPVAFERFHLSGFTRTPSQGA
jgi:L-ascorbate metabolism protein UlaG (beta-lactamase superfamily)